ncbi:hypothetical protein Vadar_008325 [Vaccinium darrowii]|uniref:Uncharacterized protein n=1 Tax=Vaccinium darrowii TaxID=229202 RepID=A0ACB7X8K6_9ERIC|nr:hypothetical protein Vadar_008325 [Vaccinium darrowii]
MFGYKLSKILISKTRPYISRHLVASPAAITAMGVPGALPLLLIEAKNSGPAAAVERALLGLRRERGEILEVTSLEGERAVTVRVDLGSRSMERRNAPQDKTIKKGYPEEEQNTNTDVYLNPPRQSLQDSRYRRAHGLGGTAVAYRSKKQQPHRLGRQIIIRVWVNCSQFEGKERDFGSDELGECKSKRDEGCDGLSPPGGWGVSWVWRVLAGDWWRRRGKGDELGFGTAERESDGCGFGEGAEGERSGVATKERVCGEGFRGHEKRSGNNHRCPETITPCGWRIFERKQGFGEKEGGGRRRRRPRLGCRGTARDYWVGKESGGFQLFL